MALFALLVLQISRGQEYRTPSLIRFLLESNRSLPMINGNAKGLIPLQYLPNELRNESQYLVKTNGKLYAGINGTGRLYELIDSSGYLKFRRIDSTFHSGYTFGALAFALGDSICSFGGYGFWKYNGALRYFNPTTLEWEPIPLQREIKGMFADHSWIDEQAGILYLEDPQVQSETLLPYPPKKIPAPLLHAIEWKSGKVNTLGNLNYNPHFGLQTPWGKLDFSAHDVELYDFRNNTIRKGSKALFLKMRKLKNPRHHAFHFMIDSTLYYGDVEHNTLDSVRLSIGAFTDPGNPIFSKKRTVVLPEGYLLLLFLPLLLFLILFLILQKKSSLKRKPAKIISTDTNEGNNHPGKNISPTFTNMEVEFLRFLLEKNKKNHPATIEDVNKLLGLSGKNEAVQKKNRSEVIALINQKWALTHGNEQPLIDRQRTDTDRRSFEYFIAEPWRNEIQSWMS